MTTRSLSCPHRLAFGVETGRSGRCPRSISVQLHPPGLCCKYHLPLFCCWLPCIHPVWGNERGTHIKNQPAKLPLDGDHIHAAFPSSSLCHVPVFLLCPLLPTFLSPNLLSIWSLSLPPFHQDSLCSARLQALLSRLSLIGRIVSGLEVCIYLLLDVSLGHCCPGAFQ